MSDIGTQFRALHEAGAPFVIPNPWDTGSARILAGMGYKALATTSAGHAFSLGVPEGTTPREAVLAHCRDLVAATPLPVSADLEKGFGDSPESCAETIRVAAGTGLAGCSIEDHTGDPDAPIFDETLAVERIAAAAEARNTLDHDFVLTARCERLLWNQPGIDPVIRRLRAFEHAGADVLYAPGLRTIEDIRAVCDAVSRPVNVIMGIPGVALSMAELAAAGVARVSVGSALARLVYGKLIEAASEIRDDGRFRFAAEAAGFDEIERFFR